MQSSARKFCAAGIAAIFAVSLPIVTSAADQADAETLAEGKAIAFDRKKGNCLACHMIDDGDLPGNAGPPLVAMKQRWPDKTALRAQIWDPQIRNPQTVMPPFGKHRILSEQELDKVVEYIHSL